VPGSPVYSFFFFHRAPRLPVPLTPPPASTAGQPPPGTVRGFLFFFFLARGGAGGTVQAWTWERARPGARLSCVFLMEKP
jgi:hypothetical protein